jgi:hypothetical protein
MQKSLTNAMWFAYRGDASVAVIAFLPGDPNASRSISLIRPGLLDRAAVARMHVFVRASRVRVRVRGLEQDAKIASRSDFGATARLLCGNATSERLGSSLVLTSCG